MENDMFNASVPITDHSHMVLHAAKSHMLSSSFIHSGIPDHISCSQTKPNGPLFSTLQEETLNDLYAANDGDMINGKVSVSRSMPQVGNISFSSCNRNTKFPQYFMGTSIPSFTNLLYATSSLHESLINLDIAPTSALPSEELRTSQSNDRCTPLNSSISTSMHCDFALPTSKTDANLDAHLNSRWNYDEASGYTIPAARMTSTAQPSSCIVGSSEVEWIPNKSTSNFDPPYSYFAPSNKISLSLVTSQPSAVNFSNVPDQCLEVSCSGVAQDASSLQDNSHIMGHSLHSVRLEKRLELGRNSANNKELPSCCDPSGVYHFPRVILKSRFLHAIQEILAEIACFALEGLDDANDPLGRIKGEAKMSSSLNCDNARGLSVIVSDKIPLSTGEVKSRGHMDPPTQQQQSNVKKSELFTMLQEVDHHYKEYLDQIQNVTSTFHSGTEMNVSFALHSISAFYKNLRKRITSQIVLAAQQSDSESMREKERSFGTSFTQKQWALQQQKRNDHQSWRPQRGLPEKSVLVLRAWMFQNFLHPYPKDSEKQLLAIRSGLTRSQVSNWFINARVRLWKPMIEEMYAEINTRSRTEEGSTSERRRR